MGPALLHSEGQLPLPLQWYPGHPRTGYVYMSFYCFKCYTGELILTKGSVFMICLRKQIHKMTTPVSLYLALLAPDIFAQTQTHRWHISPWLHGERAVIWIQEVHN